MLVQEFGKHWYKQWWGIALIILFFPILIPFLIWIKTNWDSRIRTATTVCWALIFVYGLVTQELDSKAAFASINEGINAAEESFAASSNTDQKPNQSEIINSQQLNLAELYGKTPAELKSIFPNINKVEPGGSIEITNWKSWSSIYLSFNQKKKLNLISFIPKTPLSVQEAKRIIEKDLGFMLPKSKETKTPALIAYRNMEGKIRTINLLFVDPQKDKRISEINITYSLGWNE